MGRNLHEERGHLEDFVSMHGGRAYAAVPVSAPGVGWPPGTPTHHVDAVWFDLGGAGDVIAWSDSLLVEFADLVATRTATLISPRGYADRTAFGMLIACRELFSRAYPQHQLLRAIALTDKMSRRSIVYLSEGISVIRPDGTHPHPSGYRGPYCRKTPAQAVLVGGKPDPCLDWVCHKRGIDVARFED